jgi:hypothetical protein
MVFGKYHLACFCLRLLNKSYLSIHGPAVETYVVMMLCNQKATEVGSLVNDESSSWRQQNIRRYQHQALQMACSPYKPSSIRAQSASCKYTGQVIVANNIVSSTSIIDLQCRRRSCRIPDQEIKNTPAIPPRGFQLTGHLFQGFQK